MESLGTIAIAEKISLEDIRLTDGTTAADYLASQPASRRSTETSAIFECLKRGWPLHKANIQCMAREFNC